MALINCSCRCRCSTAALAVSALVGVLGAFFQITGVITVTTAFLWVVFGIAVGYLGILTLTAGRTSADGACGCLCAAVNTLLAGILGSILLALILLAVGIVATSVVSAILVGLLLFFFSLSFTSLACLVRCLAGCGS